MKFRGGILVLCCLFISSCSFTFPDVKDLVSKATTEQNQVTYDNVVDGLLNTTNEQG